MCATPRSSAHALRLRIGDLHYATSTRGPTLCSNRMENDNTHNYFECVLFTLSQPFPHFQLLFPSCPLHHPHHHLLLLPLHPPHLLPPRPPPPSHPSDPHN